MSLKNNYPTIMPSLAMDFVNCTVLSPLVTFSRSSSATRVNSIGLIETVGNNVPRFDYDPVTLAPKGLLIEEARTNLIKASENLSAVTWNKTGTPVLDAAIQDPSGNINTVYYPTVSEIYQIFDGAGVGTISLSFFGKKREGSSNNQIVIQIFQQVSGSVIDLGSYGFSLAATNPDSTYFKNIKQEQYQNGWYRFSCQIVANTSAGTGNFSASSRIDIEGGPAQNYVWGLQIELNAFPTSYIPTTSAQVTRTADNASMTGTAFSSWYNQSEGTVAVEYDVILNTGNRVIFDIGAWGVFGTTIYGVQTGSYIGILPGTAPITVTSTVNTTSRTNKIATGLQNNSSTISVNTVLGALDSTCTMPANATTLTIGCSQFNGGFGNFLNGHIKSFKYYPQRLSNAQLQTLSK